MNENQYFERSRRVVRVIRQDDRFELRSAMGTLESSCVENFDYFQSQLIDGEFLVLERRGVNLFRILSIVKKGCVLHEVYDIAFDFDLEFGFSEEVEAEVEQYICGTADYSDCEDFTGIPFVTVDGAGTRDLDQALYVGKPGDGFWNARSDCAYVVWYAIADASWFVRPGMALFDEAVRRGTSVYFADMSVPMLPHALSRGLVSLNAEVDRRALVFVMQVGYDGVCLGTQLRRGRIHSRAKLVNEDVSAFLANPEKHAWRHAEYAESLKNFKEVGLLRIREGRTRNVVHFNRVSLDVGLNGVKTSFVLGLDVRADVDLYNEQLSLMCNMEGAKILNRLAQEDPDVLAIFRNHEAPSERDVEDVHDEMIAIARAQNMPECWYWDRSRYSLAEFFESLPPESCRSEMDGSPDEVRAYRVRQAMERAVLMMQRRSVFSPQAGLHSALGVNPYARFSAPMREIVGVFTHKEAIDAEFERDIALSREEMRMIRERVIEASNHAKGIQRDIDKAVDSCAIAHVVSHDFDLPFSERPLRRGTILGMKSSALYVRLDMPPIELKVYVKDIVESSGQAWKMSDDLTSLTSEDGSHCYLIGDPIELRVWSFEPLKKKWRVIPVT